MKDTYEIIADIIEYIADISREDLKEDSNLIEDLDLSSLEIMAIIARTEKVFDIKITCLLLLALGGMTVGSIFIYKVAFWIRYILVALLLVLFIVFVIFYMKKRKEKAMVAINESAGENESIDENIVVNENESGEENESSDTRSI